MSRPFMALLGAGAVLGAVLILVFANGSASPTYAADISRIAIDTDITGNTATPCDAHGDPALDYPCNNSTVLGTTENCRAIDVGQSIQIDVIGDSIPAGGTYLSDQNFQGAGQSDMALDWTPSGPTGPIAVTAKDISVTLVHQGPDDNSSGAFDGTSGASSTSGHWKWSDVDVNADLAGEGGKAIAMRLTIKGLNAGTAVLSLATNLLAQPTWTDIHGNEYLFGQNDGATIIVGGGTCGAGTPITTPTPTPSPSPTHCAACSPTASPSPTSTSVSTGTASPTHSPTAVPTSPNTTTPTTTQGPTPTPTPTPKPSGSATGTVAAGSGTPTPKTLPPLGGVSGGGDSLTIVFALALGALLIAAAGGSVFAARVNREE